jgi:hypothetical protein
MDVAVAQCEVIDTELDGLPGVAVAGELTRRPASSLPRSLGHRDWRSRWSSRSRRAHSLTQAQLRPSFARSGGQNGRAAGWSSATRWVRRSRHRDLRTLLDTWRAPWVQGGRTNRQRWRESVGASSSPSRAPTFAPSPSAASRGKPLSRAPETWRLWRKLGEETFTVSSSGCPRHRARRYCLTRTPQSGLGGVLRWLAQGWRPGARRPGPIHGV